MLRSASQVSTNYIYMYTYIYKVSEYSTHMLKQFTKMSMVCMLIESLCDGTD